MEREYDSREHNVVDLESGEIRVCSRLCATCVTFPDDRMLLGEDRRTDFVEGTAERDLFVICHSTLYTDQPAVCRGFWNLYRNESWPLRVAQLMCVVVEVDPQHDRVTE